MAALVVVLALSLVATSSALATTGHRYAGQFGSAGSGAAEFALGGPQGIAVRQSTGDVYVTDAAHTLADGTTPAPRIERFTASGDYQSSFGIANPYTAPGALAVDPTGAAAVYVGVLDAAAAPTFLKYTAAGAFVHALDVGSSGTTIANTTAIAVDPGNGTVYVAATNLAGDQFVDSFDAATGDFVASFTGSFSCVNGLAVDAAHHVNVLDACNGRVEQYDAAGAFVATIDDGSRAVAQTMAVDPTSGDAFVGELPASGIPQVTAFLAAGTAVPQSFGAPRIGGLGGVAVNHASGWVYVADSAGAALQRYSAFTGPTVATAAATAVGTDGATLNGTIDPGGTSSSYHFEYGIDTNYGTRTSEIDAGGGTGDVVATGPTGALIPNTTYHYRIVGSNDLGPVVGEDQSFTTAVAPATVDGTPPFVTNIGATTATLNVTVNPRGSETLYRVDYGTTTAYGASVPQPDGFVGPVAYDVTFPLDVEHLTPGTTYHYRIVADNGTGGPQNGADATFTTAPGVPGGATDVTTVAATLTGAINPHGVATTYHFDYGKSTDYDSSTPEEDGGSGTADEPVTAAITDLEPSTTYHVRVVATSSGVTRTGSDGTFRTGAAPVAKLTAATDVTPTAATLNGTADVRGVAGTYRFLVTGVGNPYTKVTDPQPVPSGGGAQSVSAELGDLPSDRTFHVILSVTSNGTTATSDEITFATPMRPPVVPPPPAAAAEAKLCTAPALDAYNARPTPGERIVITGTDLGGGGTVALGGDAPQPLVWSATGFAIQIPAGATGVLPLTVNCGTVSNTIAIALYQAPSNTFSVKATTAGSAATLRVDVPGPGAIRASGRSLKATTASAKKAGVVTLRIKLSAAASRSLARHRSLKTAVTVRFTPKGGTGRSTSVSLRFKR